MISNGDIKAVPKGMAHRAHRVNRSDHGSSSNQAARSVYDYAEDSGSNSDHEYACMVRERVTPQTVCIVCGGLGHSGTIDGVGTCLTAKMNHRIPKEDLIKIQYPSGYKPPRFFSNNKKPLPRPSARAQAVYNDCASVPSPHTQFTDPEDSNPETVNYVRKPTDRTRTTRRTTPRPKPRARATKEIPTRPPPQEDPQNSAPIAESDESDQDEHARLAVTIDSVTFDD